MDDCTRNVSVSDKFDFSKPLASIPLLAMDCESVSIARVLHAGSTLPTGHVIRFFPGNPPDKADVLHPLEAEIQTEVRQRQCMDQQKFCVMVSTLPEYVLGGILKTSTEINQVQEKSLDNDTVIINKGIQIRHVPNYKKWNIVKAVNSRQLDHGNGYCMDNINKQMVVQGKQLITMPHNLQLLNCNSNKGENEKNEIKIFQSLNDGEKKNNSNDLSKSNEVSMKVQSCKANNAYGPNDRNNDVDHSIVNKDSDSEDDVNDNVEPVCDYEPDPEPSRLEKEDDIRKPNKCYMCFKSFRQKKNMYAHIRKIHSIQPKIEGGILCPLCKMHALRQDHLRNHFETLHNVKIEKEEKLFNTMDEFLLWKERVERETLSLYVSKSSAKLLANNQQKIYYKCHRSGNFVNQRKDYRKKRINAHSSNKIGATCPAAMEVTESVNGINMIFWKTHVGHESDLPNLVLSEEHKSKRKDRLKSGMSWDKVRDKAKKIREHMPNTVSSTILLPKKNSRSLKTVNDLKRCQDPFPVCPMTKVSQGRKPAKERLLRRASQSLLIEKANLLLNYLKTSEVDPEFRPKVCLMIDNVMSTIKRRELKDIGKRENIKEKRGNNKVE